MKKVLLFVAIGLLLLAIPATIFFLGQQRDLRAKAAPATTLTLTPSPQTVRVGDTFKLNVTMNPGPNQVVSADIYITYDATKLTATAITNGANAPRVLNSGVVDNGTASIRVGAASNAQPITTPGPIAVVTLTAVGPTTAIAPATVSFASNTFVGGINDTKANVLVGTTGAKITISGTASLTPTMPPKTLLPISTASASLILTPTLTPTKAATGSSEASASALTILPVSEKGSTVSAKPVIKGKAPPGSTVTIVFHSDPQTCVAIADENGDYSCSPETPLDPGPHDVTVSVETASGTTETTSESFVVGAGGEAAMPVSGNVETTVVLVVLGVIFLASGALIPIFIR